MCNIQKKDNIIDDGYSNDIDRGPAFLPQRYIGESFGLFMLNPRHIMVNSSYYDRHPEKYDPELADLDLWNKLVDYGNPVIMKVKLKQQ